MSTTQVNFQDDDNLTTDSVPSPPRDDPEQKENISNRNSFSSSGKRPSYDNTKTQQIPQSSILFASFNIAIIKHFQRTPALST